MEAAKKHGPAILIAAGATLIAMAAVGNRSTVWKIVGALGTATAAVLVTSKVG